MSYEFITLLGGAPKLPPSRKSPHPVRLGHPSVFHVCWWRLSCRSSCSCHAHAAACIRQRSTGRRATSNRLVARVQQGGRHALHRLVRTKNKRPPFVSWTRPRTLRCSTIS